MATTKPLPPNLGRGFPFCLLTHPSPVLAGCRFLYTPRPSFAVIGRDVSYVHGAGAPGHDSARLAQAFCSGAHVAPVGVVRGGSEGSIRQPKYGVEDHTMRYSVI